MTTVINMRGKGVPLHRRIEAAKAALPYVHTKVPERVVDVG